ncbi:MAG TPA: DUF4154 domain-containing protein [Marinilabiliales bacterium]|jgi:hypothetical protein|nr:MAG: hypothetical protein A2W95_18950 [Bacteroidetes bacterium GWA2_40_14]OFX62796.1 MAG: hypothetical protein A2W84_10805 [Bacteroidetes bacterium GWC2_40_13]OFX72137.1 MAG: hypothetical protein A2W96_00140 [Bacteroidetes bacterium GWD2_40_43]OFX92523.1 MAG: hypothetical protein A2W97_10915 [Bacteroidetes bacterium GWE2_40_63]OFY16461.1 MAG: hypothetical protein A2W88_18275 [Bacteroidetes bacterium GWF2_40_13]OFZ27202.1 MAG: hypothetical protein A2437_18840 [Bacteroidetes bacterium RIFOXYC
MKKILLFLFIFAFLHSMAQEADVAKYKAMFTLNFIRNIGWPEASKEGDFVIGVLKEPNVAANLKTQTVGKKFGYQNIVIKEFKNVEEVTDCQLLFFSRSVSFSKNSEAIIQKLGGSNSLIITESEGAINSGSMINFVVRDDKLKFEISASNAEKFGLKFSTSLSTLSNAIVK